MKPGQRPTGIIRTLPWFGADDRKHNDQNKRKALERLMTSLKMIEKGNLDQFYVALAQMPTKEVLHFYILIGGLVRVRCNLSGFVSGASIGTVHCFDDSKREAKWWAVLTAPVSWPPEEIKMRGFQGFRYTESLW